MSEPYSELPLLHQYLVQIFSPWGSPLGVFPWLAENKEEAAKTFIRGRLHNDRRSRWRRLLRQRSADLIRIEDVHLCRIEVREFFYADGEAGQPTCIYLRPTFDVELAP